MKIPNIAASLGWTETPELNEGLFLQPEEVRKIEKDLGTANASNSNSKEADKKKPEKQVPANENSGPDYSLIDMVTAANKKAAENRNK